MHTIQAPMPDQRAHALPTSVPEYTPSTGRHGLSAFLHQQREKTLVLVAQDLTHWPVSELTVSANRAALAHGYHLISLDYHRSALRERALLQALCDGYSGGCLFLWDHFPENLDLYITLARKLPCIQVIDPKPIARLDFIGMDDYSGGMLAVRHLLNLGYRQIGHVTLRAPLQGLSERRQAYQDVLRQAALPLRKEWMLELPYGLLEADRLRRIPSIRAFLSQPQLPKALFVCADWVASEVIECAAEMGFPIPQRLAVVGYDDALPYCLTRVPLTTVSLDAQQIGRLAVERLLLRLHGETSNEPYQLLLPPTLVVRESSTQVSATTERWAFAIRHVQDHFRRDISAREVASLLGLDSHYFSHQFRQVFGKRFTEYVQELRLKYAAELLVTTDHTVEDIALDAGFQSLNHFYTLFKRSYHVSPHAYRQHHPA